MPATVEGRIRYAQVLGSSLRDRSCFDGTVPRCFSCSSQVIYTTDTDWAAGETIFSLTGVPRNDPYSLDTDDARRVLTSQSVVSLRDLWVNCEGESTAQGANFRDAVLVTLAVCDPSAAFPDAANTNYLYQAVLYLSSDNGDRMIRIPDIDGLVIARGLNVVCRISFSGSANSQTVISFHGVSVVDD